MKNWTAEVIKEVAENIESYRSRVSNRQNPYNVFTAWKMSENDHTKMFLLCNCVIGHHSLKKLSEEDCFRLYAFRDEVAEVRHQMREEIANGREQNIRAVENLYKVCRRLIRKIERISCLHGHPED